MLGGMVRTNHCERGQAVPILLTLFRLWRSKQGSQEPEPTGVDLSELGSPSRSRRKRRYKHLARRFKTHRRGTHGLSSVLSRERTTGESPAFRHGECRTSFLVHKVCKLGLYRLRNLFARE
jgi:hypothetical protein